MGRLLDELMALPTCEMIGGPLDGRKFKIADHRETLRFRDTDRPIIDTYRREPETTKFYYVGRVVDKDRTKPADFEVSDTVEPPAEV